MNQLNQIAKHGDIKMATNKPERATIAMAWSDPEQDKWGDEFLQHYASFGDDDGEPVGKIWKFGDADSAVEFAYNLFEQHDLEDVLNETMF